MNNGEKSNDVPGRLFHRLQLRFTAILTVICSVLVAITFFAAVLVNVTSLEIGISTSLDTALSLPLDYIVSDDPNYESCAVAVVTESGTFEIRRYEHMTDNDFGALLTTAINGETNVSKSGRSYRIASREIDFRGYRGTVYAFYDCTYRLHVFYIQFIVMCASFAGLIILLSVFAYVISGRMLSPAHEALVKQKDLIANASHELKTPITIINANLDVICSDDGATVGDNEKWLGNISSQTERMHSLVTEMLEMSSFESAGFKPIFAEFDLGELAEGQCLSFEAACFERGIMLEFRREEIPPVISDERCWIKLIGILLDNAVKYSDDGSKISAALSVSGTKKKRTAHFSVSNTGKTIPPEEIEFIFERFHKVGDNSDSFGLGLAMAKTMCETLGGKISCASANGTTTFAVNIPVRVEPKKQKDEKQQKKEG